MAQKHIMIVCGEPSGDLNAAHLIQAIKEINPDIKISGVAGRLVSQTQAEVYSDIKELAVIGLFDVLKKLPKFFKLKQLIIQRIKIEKPDAIILVDFSGFNLRLAKAINKTLPLIYYIGPQVWASRAGRIKTIKEYIQKLIVIFKFEEEFYKKHGVSCDFVGHPLLDIVQPTMEKKEFLQKFGLSDNKLTFALLPGSRKQEVENILPVMVKASILIQESLKGIQFIIAKSPQVEWNIYQRKILNTDIDIKIIEGKTYNCLQAADFCLVASGSATLETAIMQKPFVIIYKMHLLNYLLYLPQVRVPYIGMVNIVAKRKIIPEFIQFQAVPKKISEQILEIFNDPLKKEQIKNDLRQVKAALGEKGAAKRAAQIILDFLKVS